LTLRRGLRTHGAYAYNFFASSNTLLPWEEEASNASLRACLLQAALPLTRRPLHRTRHAWNGTTGLFSMPPPSSSCSALLWSPPAFLCALPPSRMPSPPAALTIAALCLLVVRLCCRMPTPLPAAQRAALYRSTPELYGACAASHCRLPAATTFACHIHASVRRCYCYSLPVFPASSLPSCIPATHTSTCVSHACTHAHCTACHLQHAFSLPTAGCLTSRHGAFA